METITTDKEAFEYIRTHLLKQGQPAWNISDDCGYRGHTRSQLDELWQQAKSFDYADSDDEYDDRYYLFLSENWDRIPYAQCAVGCIIKDQYYDDAFEGNSIDDDDVMKAVAKSNPKWENPSLRMLVILQRVHDAVNYDFWDKVLDSQNWSFNLDGDFVSYSGYMEEKVVPNYTKNYN